MPSSSTLESLTQPRLIEFSTCGLDLFVGHSLGPVYNFVVSTDILSNASPVLEDLLGTRDSSRSIILADDDPTCWLIMLDIVHNRVDDIPKELSGEELVKFASHSEKYDLVHVCREHVDRWLEKVEDLEQQVDILDRLWIYWAFGHPMKAKQMMALAINDVMRDEEGRWVDCETRRVIEDRPPGLLAHLKKQRTAKIEKFNTLFQRLIYQSDDPSEQKYDPISCKVIFPTPQISTTISLKETAESKRAHAALQEIRDNCRVHIMLQIYKLARPYFRRYTEGMWRESDVRVPGQQILNSIGKIAGVIEEMGMALEEFDREVLRDWRRKSKEDAEKKAAGEASSKSDEENHDRPVDHSHCVPREELCKLSRDMLIGGSVLTRFQAGYLLEQEKKRTGAETSEYSIEELQKEFEWPEEVSYGN